VHFAVNCASIGCLRCCARGLRRGSPRRAARIADAAVPLRPRTRNRYDAAKNVLEVSKIFDWFQRKTGSRATAASARDAPAIGSREQFFAKYRRCARGDAEGRQAVRSQKVPLAFLDYDWTLNDVRR